LGVYRVQGTTKEKFDANAIQVDIQYYHIYIVPHATRVVNVTTAYQAKHKIVNNDMV
jgi:hypothetical protein